MNSEKFSSGYGYVPQEEKPQDSKESNANLVEFFKDRFNKAKQRAEQAKQDVERAKNKARLATFALIGAAVLLAGCGESDTAAEQQPTDSGEDGKPKTESTDTAASSVGSKEVTINGTTVDISGETSESDPFIPNGYVDTANGEVECFIYEGGYHEEDDPYLTKFAHQNDENYEGDHTYGLEIEGDTITEKTTNWLKEVAKSPEAIVRLRTQMGLEPDLDSIKAENELANKIREMSPDQYDKTVNDTIGYFFDRLKGGHIEESVDWVLESDMRDEHTGNHTDSEVYGRFSGDDMIGGTKDLLVTFYDKDNINIISDGSAMQHVLESAIENQGYQAVDKIGYTDYINYTDGGTHCFKPGVNISFNTPPEESETPPEKPEEPEKPVTPPEKPVTPPEVPPTTQTGGGNPTPEQPFVPETPEEKASKDKKNAERIDNNAATGMAGAYDSIPVEHAPVAPVEEQPVTEKPSGGDYEGTEATFVQNEPSKEAETVGVQPAPAPIPETPGTDVGANSSEAPVDNPISPENNYSGNQAPANTPVGPAQPDNTPPAQEVEAPSEPGTALDDILAGVGI